MFFRFAGIPANRFFFMIVYVQKFFHSEFYLYAGFDPPLRL